MVSSGTAMEQSHSSTAYVHVTWAVSVNVCFEVFLSRFLPHQHVSLMSTHAFPFLSVGFIAVCLCVCVLAVGMPCSKCVCVLVRGAQSEHFADT